MSGTPPNATLPRAGQKPASGQSHWGVKIYLVLLPDNVAKPGEPNRKIIGWKLTRASAEAIRDKWPGSYIVRGEADKL